MNLQPVLSVSDLKISAPARDAETPLLKGVTFDVGESEVVALVGESGSGKSLTIRACMRLLPPKLHSSGEIRFAGNDIGKFNHHELQRYRSRNVAMIHQDPRSCINPTRTIRQFLLEGPVQTGLMKPAEAEEAARTLIRDVGIADPARRMSQYPHQLSGGMLQRMMIVAALLPDPQLILADEPTTALDVTVQSDVMAILTEQTQLRGTSMLIVTHDLDLAAAVSDRLIVMHDGMVVEAGSTPAVYEQPQHSYTKSLLAARPSVYNGRLLVHDAREKPDHQSDQCRGLGEYAADAVKLHDLGDRHVACQPRKDDTES